MHDRATWQPVLDDEDRACARRVVLDIAQALADRGPHGEPDASDAADLTDGLSGQAVFFAQLGLSHGSPTPVPEVPSLLERAIDACGPLAGSPALYAGITGVAWTVQHLARHVRQAHLDALPAIDAAMLRSLSAPPGPAEFDLMSGLVGLGVLALERLPEPGAARTLELLVDWLQANAEPVHGGISWRALPHTLHEAARREFPEGCHFPGIAHGTAGVVGLLASLLAHGVRPADTRRLLAGGVTWLLAQELPGHQALFPFQTVGQDTRPPSRSAWCTGGPGISWALWRAGAAAGESDWCDAARRLARAAAERPLAACGVHDACLCHGAAGLLLLYARWFHATGDGFFRDEARRWFRRTLQHRHAGTGVAGFAAVNRPQNRVEPARGLLFGAAGIGLGLLAAATEQEPCWDRVMLLSHRAPDGAGAAAH